MVSLIIDQCRLVQYHIYNNNGNDNNNDNNNNYNDGSIDEPKFYCIIELPLYSSYILLVILILSSSFEPTHIYTGTRFINKRKGGWIDLTQRREMRCTNENVIFYHYEIMPSYSFFFYFFIIIKSNIVFSFVYAMLHTYTQKKEKRPVIVPNWHRVDTRRRTTRQ